MFHGASSSMKRRSLIGIISRISQPGSLSGNTLHSCLKYAKFESQRRHRLSRHSGDPGSCPGQIMSYLWRTKWHWGRFYPSTSVPLSISVPPILPQSSSSNICCWHNMPNSGHNTKWTYKGMVQSDISKTALIFFFTVRAHITNSTVKILAAKTHCKYFF
jgi:hypothetical protein